MNPRKNGMPNSSPRNQLSVSAAERLLRFFISIKAYPTFPSIKSLLVVCASLIVKKFLSAKSHPRRTAKVLPSLSDLWSLHLKEFLLFAPSTVHLNQPMSG